MSASLIVNSLIPGPLDARTRVPRPTLPLTLSLSPAGGEGIEMTPFSLSEGEGRREGGAPVHAWCALGHDALDQGKELAPGGGEAVLGDTALAGSAAEGRRLVRVIQEMADGVSEGADVAGQNEETGAVQDL